MTTTYAPEMPYTLDKATGHIAPAVDEAEIKRLDDDYLLHVYARLPITLVRGQGVRAWDANGKEYLDFLAGIAVNGVGHCHPRVVQAIQEQAATLIHTSGYYYTAPVAKLAEKLTAWPAWTASSSATPARRPTSARLKLPASSQIARRAGQVSASSVRTNRSTGAHGDRHGRPASPSIRSRSAPVVQGFTHVRSTTSRP